MDYLNKTVWATLGRSHIEGIGVISIRGIPKGTTFTDYNIHSRKFKLYKPTVEEFKQLLPEIQKLILDRTCFPKGMDPLEFYSPNQEQCMQSFLNHSPNPNTDGKITLRDVKKGEELTEDYTKLYPEGIHRLNETMIKHMRMV